MLPKQCEFTFIFSKRSAPRALARCLYPRLPDRRFFTARQQVGLLETCLKVLLWLREANYFDRSCQFFTFFQNVLRGIHIRPLRYNNYSCYVFPVFSRSGIGISGSVETDAERSKGAVVRCVSGASRRGTRGAGGALL